MISSEKYYETDTYDLFIETLRFSQVQVLEALSNLRSIPWAITGTHTLVQMSCITALDERDTTQTACLSDQKVKGGKTVRQATFDLMHTGQFENLPDLYLASPASLLRRVQDANDVMGQECFQLDDEMTSNLETLNSFRDTVNHFLPSSWSLELSGMPDIFKSAFEFALLTLRSPGTYSHRIESSTRDKAKQTCVEMINKLSGGE